MLFRMKQAMDSLIAGRYAELMRLLSALSLIFGTALLGVTDVTVQADDAPVLGVLEYSGGLLPKRADIRKTGAKVKSPYPNLRQQVWVLLPGDTLQQEFIPRERVIQFLKLTGHTPQLVCSVMVRYARTEKGWRPTYLLLKQPPMTCTEAPKDSATKTVNRKNPTTGGFDHLRIGFASRPGQIDGWIVH